MAAGEGAKANTHDVTVDRKGRWWVFRIPELRADGQAKSLAEIKYQAQGVAARWLDVEPDTLAVEVDITRPDAALTEWVVADQDEAAARRRSAPQWHVVARSWRASARRTGRRPTEAKSLG
jgi:hypothetical protein